MTDLKSKFYQETKKLFERNSNRIGSSLLESMKNHPTDMSYYFPKIEKGARESGFSIPKTVFLTVPDEFIISIYNSEVSVEEHDAMDILLHDILKEADISNDELFVKTGSFSNKFMFKDPHVTNNESLSKAFKEVLYNSLLVGAAPVNTMVIREYIKPKESPTTIYDGMPLREEWRFFVDFDKQKVLGYSFYWHPEEMKTLISREIDLTDQKDIKREAQQLLLDEETPDYKKDRLNNYLSWHDWYYNKYENDNQKPIPPTRIIGKLRDFASNKNNTLTGQWSIDIMLENDNDKDYLIDAAPMNSSALVDKMVKLP